MPGALGSARPLNRMGDCACPDLPLRTLEGYAPGKETWTPLPTNALWCAGKHLHEVPVFLPAINLCLVVETPCWFSLLRPAMAILSGSTSSKAACNAVLNSGVSCSTQTLPSTLPHTNMPGEHLTLQNHSQSTCNKALGLQTGFRTGPRVNMSWINYHVTSLTIPKLL